MFLMMFTLLSAESKVIPNLELGDGYVNPAEALVITLVGVIAFPGLIAADVYALSLQNSGICDEDHNVYVYVPVPKTGGLKEAKFSFTCAEWVAD